VPAVQNRPLRRLILLLDTLVLTASMAGALAMHPWLRHFLPWIKSLPGTPAIVLIVYLVVPIWLALVSVFGLHRTFERAWSAGGLLVDLAKVHAAGFLTVSALDYATQLRLNRSLFGVFLVTSFVLLYLERLLLGRWHRYQHALGHARRRLLLVGDPGEEMLALVARARAESLPPELVGYLGPEREGSQLRRCGALADLEQVLHDGAVDAVLFFPPHNHPRDVAAALLACETVGVPAEFSIDIVQPAQATPRVVSTYGRPFVSFDVAPKPPEQLALKHAFDFVASALGLLVLSPLLLLVALAILLTMGRPILFAQERAGLFGRRFRMLKFRTMRRDAEAMQNALRARNEMTGPVFKLTRDPRVTRLGHWLRRASIDELPQLINVLLGSMSLVGPRPLPSSEQQAMSGWHRRRLSMKPGVTGLWQVSGRNDVDFEQWMRLDLRYVDEWSLGLDAKILVRTIPAVLLGRGAK
jgi:exopolysaccharide biosynthesis polyprenyl glycosylphosphotransferase